MAELQDKVEEIVKPLPWDAWRFRCPNCGAAQWKQVGEEPLRLVFECLSCHEASQVDLLSVKERV